MSAVNNWNASSNQPVLVNTSAMLSYKYVIVAHQGNGVEYIGFSDKKAASTAFLRLKEALAAKDGSYHLTLKYAGIFNSFKMPRHPEYTNTKMVGPVRPTILKESARIDGYEYN